MPVSETMGWVSGVVRGEDLTHCEKRGTNRWTNRCYQTSVIEKGSTEMTAASHICYSPQRLCDQMIMRTRLQTTLILGVGGGGGILH